METDERAVMHKETILKEDGRYLIYYRFEAPQAPRTEEPKAEGQ